MGSSSDFCQSSFITNFHPEPIQSPFKAQPLEKFEGPYSSFNIDNSNSSTPPQRLEFVGLHNWRCSRLSNHITSTSSRSRSLWRISAPSAASAPRHPSDYSFQPNGLRARTAKRNAQSSQNKNTTTRARLGWGKFARSLLLNLSLTFQLALKTGVYINHNEVFHLLEKWWRIGHKTWENWDQKCVEFECGTYSERGDKYIKDRCIFYWPGPSTIIQRRTFKYKTIPLHE